LSRRRDNLNGEKSESVREFSRFGVNPMPEYEVDADILELLIILTCIAVFAIIVGVKFL